MRRLLIQAATAALLGAIIGAVAVFLLTEGSQDGAIMGAIVGGIIGLYVGVQYDFRRHATRFEQVHPESPIAGKTVSPGLARAIQDSYRGPTSGAAQPGAMSQIDTASPEALAPVSAQRKHKAD